MTALAGMWSMKSPLRPREACERMLRAQGMYGTCPDAVWAFNDIAIGSRLHPTLPEDRLSLSTVQGESGLVVAGDIRIDNRTDVAEALGLASSQASSLSDVVLFTKAWERWADTAFAYIRGDFAVAVWEPVTRRLVLGRDFASQRPLHYHRSPGFFAFSSMPKGLHAIEEIPRRPDLDKALIHLALLGEGDGRSFFADIAKVRPGSFVSVSERGVSEHRFWNPNLSPLRLRDSGEYQEALLEKLDAAVSARLRGTNGSVGSHLSAGLDSSSVTASAALQSPPNGRVTAFTSVPREGFKDAGSPRALGNEGPLAAEVAKLYPNIDHVLVPTGDASPVEALDRHFFLYEIPVLNPINMLWLDAIKGEAARRRLNVVLTGARGNLSLSYSGLSVLGDLAKRGRIFELARVISQMRAADHSWRNILSNIARPLIPSSFGGPIDRIRGRKDYLSSYSFLQTDFLEKIVTVRESIPRYSVSSASAATKIKMLFGADYGNYNKGTLAGWGIDTRDPTSDKELVEFSLRIPGDQWLRNGMPRFLVKSAMSKRLPHSLLQEKRKGRQAADWYVQFPGYLEEADQELHLLGRCAEARQVLNLAGLREVLNRWGDGRPDDAAMATQYRIGLMRAIAAGSFIRKATGTN